MNESELHSILLVFSGKCPNEYKRFLSILRDHYNFLLEKLATVNDYGDMKHLQGQVYILKKLISYFEE